MSQGRLTTAQSLVNCTGSGKEGHVDYHTWAARARRPLCHSADRCAVDPVPGATSIVESMDTKPRQAPMTAIRPQDSERECRSGGKGTADRQDPGSLLDEQAAYYRALAPDYLDQCLDLPGVGEITEALGAFNPRGSVLELACGPGVWTGRLLRYAADVTAVDASPEMLAIAAPRVGRERVRFIQADLFTWRPDRRYDVVFFGFWLSHVPAEHFASFWSLVADCLKAQGRVFFVDDAYRTADELMEGPSSSTIRRQIPDGTAYRIVKVPYQPGDLERRIGRLGWDIKVTATAGPFYWGAGRPEQWQGRYSYKDSGYPATLWCGS